MCLEHIRLSLPGLFIPSTYLLYIVQLYWGFLASGNLQEKEFYLLNSYTLFSCILRNIIISTSPWQPGSKNRKDCPILYIIYQMIKGCYCKLFQEHSGLNFNLCNGNTFIDSVCLCKGWTFIFKGGEKISGRYLAVNGMSIQVGGGRRSFACKVKGNLLIKQSTFAVCRERLQKYLGGVQPFTSSFLFYAVRNTQNSLGNKNFRAIKTRNP